MRFDYDNGTPGSKENLAGLLSFCSSNVNAHLGCPFI